MAARELERWDRVGVLTPAIQVAELCAVDLDEHRIDRTLAGAIRQFHAGRPHRLEIPGRGPGDHHDEAEEDKAPVHSNQSIPSRDVSLGQSGYRSGVAVAALIAEDWEFDPLEPAGAAELYRRLDAAKPQRVRRAELEGHVGLTVRELYELGCTLAPLNARRIGGMTGWRLAVIGAALVASIGVAGALIGCLDALGIDRGDNDPYDAGTGLGVAAVFLAMAYGGLALLRRGIRGLRTLAARRRLAGGNAARRPADDPHGRATVAVVRGPGLVRVQLLWVRGHAEDAAYVEVRMLAERRIEEDDAGRAEDAIAALSEIALRADNAHALRQHGGLAALGLRRRRRTVAERPRAPDARRAAKPRLEVGPTWEPEPLTDAGQAELSRRVCVARRERWSAAVLEPLLVTRAAGVPRNPPPWPRERKHGPAHRDLRKPVRWAVWGGIVTFVFCMFSNDGAPPTADAVAIGCAGLAVAAVAVLVSWLSAHRGPGRRLARAVRAAAGRPPRALEQGLPGSAGLVYVARARGKIALLHVRPAPDDGQAGELEVRTIATREVDDDDLDALSAFCTIAAEARLRSQGVGRSAHYLQTLLARLGHVPATIGEPALRREPLAWIAVLLGGVLVAASVKHFVAGTWFEHGVGSRAISYAWVVLAAYIVVTAARRIRDPYAL